MTRCVAQRAEKPGGLVVGQEGVGIGVEVADRALVAQRHRDLRRLHREADAGHLVGQLVGGCVSQVGEQTFNIARTAWLSAGLPLTVAATTVDSQCGSSQQATSLAASLVAGGAVDVAIGCGVESMSRVPIGSGMRTDFGVPTPKSYFGRYEMTSQFEGAERIAEKWGITREDTDKFVVRCLQSPLTGGDPVIYCLLSGRLRVGV